MYWMVYNSRTGELVEVHTHGDRDDAIREGQAMLGVEEVEDDEEWHATMLSTEQAAELGHDE